MHNYDENLLILSFNLCFTRNVFPVYETCCVCVSVPFKLVYCTKRGNKYINITFYLCLWFIFFIIIAHKYRNPNFKEKQKKKHRSISKVHNRIEEKKKMELSSTKLWDMNTNTKSKKKSFCSSSMAKRNNIIKVSFSNIMFVCVLICVTHWTRKKQKQQQQVISSASLFSSSIHLFCVMAVWQWNHFLIFIH